MNINEVLHDVRQASRRLALLDEKQINEVLFAVADAGLLMPPKSTWFEPKLRSGLFIHEI